ncbi:MAG: hypothetical protein RLZ45_432 [Verrucomicrobiota bacterium]
MPEPRMKSGPLADPVSHARSLDAFDAAQA